jgi:hypothetical protein
MACRPAMDRESAPPHMHVAHVDHRRAHLGWPFIVCAMAPRATRPRGGPLHHPTCLEGRDALGPCWPRLHLAVPPGALCAHPGEQRLRMLLVVGHYRFKTRPSGRLEPREPWWGGDTGIQPCPRAPHDPQPAQPLHPQMARAPVDLLAALIAPLATAHRRGLDRWAREARGPGGGLPPRVLASRGAPGVQPPGPRALVAPPRAGIVPGALGPSIVRTPLPLTPAPRQRHEGMDDFAPGHRSRAAPTVGLGCRHPRFQNSPLGVRQIRGIRLAGRLCLRQGCALLSQSGRREWSNT